MKFHLGILILIEIYFGERSRSSLSTKLICGTHGITVYQNATTGTIS